jgi:alpha-1,2-mannosyltransferase
VGGPSHLHFTYPPFAALVVTPLAVLPFRLAKLVLSAVSVGCLYVCLHVVSRRLTVRPAVGEGWVLAGFAVAIWLEPVRATIDFGQVNLVLLALVVVDILVVRDARWSGVLVGVAAAIKLTPLAFIPYLFLIGRRRAAGNAVVAFVVCGLAGFAADPSASRTYWGQHRFVDAHRIGRVENASNQSVRGILARMLRTTHVPAWWVVVAAAIFIAGTTAAVLIYRAGFPVWSLTAMGTAALIASPISWSHHWVWCAVMLPVCVDLVRVRARARYAVVAVLVLLPFAAGLVFWAPHVDHRELADTSFQQVVSATYVLAGVLLVAALGWAAWWRSQERASLPPLHTGAAAG